MKNDRLSDEAYESRDIPFIAEKLKLVRINRRENMNIGCTLLIGAGCSKEAGIPLASEFVEIIRKENPEAYRQAQKISATDVPSYSNCMAQLTEFSRRALFSKYVDNAKINWAHLCVATLMKAGFVDRILTTNFDSLIVRACALIGEFPAVYDFAASQLLKPKELPPKSVFHLHGQRTGFVLLNTEEQLTQHSKLLGPLIQDSKEGRIWIVVGYSGENDAVFQHIAKDELDNELFWVGYKDILPSAHVLEQLLAKDNAFLTRNYDADAFFKELAHHLGIFPPGILSRPFSHLAEALEKLKADDELARNSRQWIQIAITQFEKPVSLVLMTGFFYPPTSLDTHQFEIQEDFQALIASLEVMKNKMSTVHADRLCRAYLKLGDLLTSLGCSKTEQAAAALFLEAESRYQSAIDIKPKSYEAFNNWGVALYRQATTRTRVEAGDLLAGAIVKYRNALDIQPESYEAVNNLGVALYQQARMKEGEEVRALLVQGIQQFEQAVALKTCGVEALNNMGNALVDLARTKSDDAARMDLERAIAKFEAATEIDPDQLQILNNLGAAYIQKKRTERIPDNDHDQDEWGGIYDEMSLLNDEVSEVARRADSVRMGGGAYITACRFAMDPNAVNDCVDELRRASKFRTLPSREYLMHDPNLAGIRDRPEFLDFIRRFVNPDY
jgi:tetratricopeptide (TPR) repeat protein